MAKTLLSAQDLSYGFDPLAPLFESIYLSLQSGDRVALVGRNGCGKSTLIKLLAGHLTPTQGTITRYGSLAYVPQVSTLSPTVYNGTILDFMSAASEDWWCIDELLRNQLATPLDLALPIASLSGGELMKLLLATALTAGPDILLLDEPTNHLDLLALDCLQACLETFSGGLVMVSHKPYFLDQVVSKIWDLTPQRLREYGGNYSAYQEQIQTQQLAAERNHEIAKKDLKQAKAAVLSEQKRAAQSRRSGEGKAASGSMGKMAKHYFANRASGTAGNAAKRNQATLDQAAQRVAETKIKTTKASIIQLEEASQKRRTLLEICDGRLRVEDKVLIHDIQLHIVSGDRVALAGGNGSGKSSLVKALFAHAQGRETSATADPLVLESTNIRLAEPLKMVYLDQTYGFVNRHCSVLENMQAANPDLPYQALRQQLGHFLFFGFAVEKPASALSGGELARLALAMISITAIDLLILDEPTNNLDLETVETIIEALNHYRGALWAISHDVDFLSKIEINRAFQIRHQTLEPMNALPQSVESYYQELLFYH